LPFSGGRSPSAATACYAAPSTSLAERTYTFADGAEHAVGADGACVARQPTVGRVTVDAVISVRSANRNRRPGGRRGTISIHFAVVGAQASFAADTAETGRGRARPRFAIAGSVCGRAGAPHRRTRRDGEKKTGDDSRGRHCFTPGPHNVSAFSSGRQRERSARPTSPAAATPGSAASQSRGMFALSTSQSRPTKQGNSSSNAHISDVEYRPVWNVDEINDVAPHHPI
jgi:hypothetical protein